FDGYGPRTRTEVPGKPVRLVLVRAELVVVVVIRDVFERVRRLRGAERALGDAAELHPAGVHRFIIQVAAEEEASGKRSPGGCRTGNELAPGQVALFGSDL